MSADTTTKDPTTQDGPSTQPSAVPIPQIPRFPVKTSSIITSSIIFPGLELVTEPSEIAQLYHKNSTSESNTFQRLRSLRYLSRMRAEAEEELADKEAIEITMLLHASEVQKSYADLGPSDAFLLAKLTQDVLLAKKKVADLQVQEAKVILEVKENAAEQALTHYAYAERQVSSVDLFCRSMGFSVDYTRPPPELLPLQFPPSRPDIEFEAETSEDHWERVLSSAKHSSGSSPSHSPKLTHEPSTD